MTRFLLFASAFWLGLSFSDNGQPTAVDLICAQGADLTNWSELCWIHGDQPAGFVGIVLTSNHGAR